jgi:multiple sugar transport system substrate-binding protein
METPHKVTSNLSHPALGRRRFLRTSMAASAGLAGILLTKTPPAVAQERKLTLLTWTHSVVASDEELQRQLEEFGNMAGIKVRLDRVDYLTFPAVHSTEVQNQKGHDLTFLRIDEPHLYAKHLVNLDELVDKIGPRAGGGTDEIAGRGKDEHFRAIPWYFNSFPLVVRTDLIAELGENLPDTWEDVHRVGQKLKAKGHPVGIQLSRCFDSNAILRGIIWSWGGKLVETDGKTVAFNSKETIEAYKFVKALYQDTMEKEVVGWEDLNNNVCLNSAKCSMILNPISAYNTARKDNLLLPTVNRPVYQVLTHILPPKGPVGRHMSAVYNLIGIWKWSPLQDMAKAFLDFHFQDAQQARFLTASRGYNQPFLRAFSLHSIYASNPTFYFHPYIGQYTHALGWPGAPTAAAQVVWDKYIIPDSVAECATGKSTAAEAVKKAESQIKKEYRQRA